MEFIGKIIDFFSLVAKLLGFKDAKEQQKTEEELRKAEANISVEEGKKERKDNFDEKVDEHWNELNK